MWNFMLLLVGDFMYVPIPGLVHKNTEFFIHPVLDFVMVDDLSGDFPRHSIHKKTCSSASNTKLILSTAAQTTSPL